MTWLSRLRVLRGRRLALLLAVLAAACSHDAPEEVESESIIPVSTVAAEIGSIRAVVHATGLVAPAPGAELIVTAPEPARIAEMPKAEGELVRRGDVLVRFDIPTVTADLAGKRAAVPAARERLATARANQARARDLFERGVAARKEVEDAGREEADAQAALASAEAAWAGAEAVSARSEIRAPFDGLVARRSHNPGDLVDASAADAVLHVIDPRRLEVHASVPIADAARVRLGAPARLILAADADPIALTVVSRPVTVDPGTAALSVRLAFTTPAGLAAGTPVQVDIDAESHEDVVLIPVSAVVREGSEAAVFVAADGKAARRAIVIGIVAGDRVEVRSGLKAGDEIVTDVPAGLPDGAAISTAGRDK